MFDKETLRWSKRKNLQWQSKSKMSGKKFFLKSFAKSMNQDQKNIFLNAINLCNYRNMILKLFEDKNIETIHYPYNAKSEELEEKSKSESGFKKKFSRKNKNENTKQKIWWRKSIRTRTKHINSRSNVK